MSGHALATTNRSVVLQAWGDRIAQRRQDLRYTQARLGELVGIGQTSISKIEKGRVDPSYELKWKIAGALGVSLHELFAYPPVVPPFPVEAA